MRNIKLFFIKNDYIDYLRRFDDKVPYNKNEKLLEIDEKHFQNLAGLRKICFRDGDNLSNEQKKIRNRCCNLPLLESIYKEYKRRMP